MSQFEDDINYAAETFVGHFSDMYEPGGFAESGQSITKYFRLHFLDYLPVTDIYSRFCY